jgi:hypothetical protein
MARQSCEVQMDGHCLVPSRHGVDVVVHRQLGHNAGIRNRNVDSFTLDDTGDTSRSACRRPQITTEG